MSRFQRDRLGGPRLFVGSRILLHNNTSSQVAGYTGMSTANNARLDALLERLREAASSNRQTGSPEALIQFLVDEEAWVIDTRGFVPPERTVRVEAAEDADCTVTLSAETLFGLLDGTLSPLRAWAQRRISVAGDKQKLKALGFLNGAGAAKAARSALGGASITVRGANADTGHGSYQVVVTEEAACWSVWRRWRELKALAADLTAGYGPNTPYAMALPSLPQHSLRSSGSAAVLRYRMRVMESYLSELLELLPTSPRTGK